MERSWEAVCTITLCCKSYKEVTNIPFQSITITIVFIDFGFRSMHFNLIIHLTRMYLNVNHQ